MIDIKTKISSFFLFNSSFGPKEGEELKRILFFHPKDVSSDARKTQVGLCEAVVKFMCTFSTEPCEALQTQTKRYMFYQPEEDYWMVLVANIPYTTKAHTSTGEGQAEFACNHSDRNSSRGGNCQQCNNKTQCHSSLEESYSTHPFPEASIMSNLLVSAYNTFRMFMGPLKDIPIENIYSICEKFFTPFIQSRNLCNDITEVIKGVNYLPLDKNCFYKVICFIDLLEINYPDFNCISFVYNDKLIWNGLAPNDMLTLYQYLVESLLPSQIEKELQGGAVAAAERHGRFISPPEGIRYKEDLQNLTKIHVTREDETESKEYYLIIYRTLSATVCFTIDVKTPLDIESFRSLDAFIGPQLSIIASTISEQCAVNALQAAQLINADHKFVYFNRLNYAFKASPSLNKLVPSTTLKPEVLSIIAGIHGDRQSLGNYGEVIIKTPHEYWITGKSSNNREFYVVIQEKNANLKEIADEVRRISESQLKGIFFYPM
ncbi:hypothetical protein ACJJTC_013261 [Scirpophaga incertulas]